MVDQLLYVDDEWTDSAENEPTEELSWFERWWASALARDEEGDDQC